MFTNRLLLLTRLGLRAVEVARLRVEDIDWRHGELLVLGKGNRDERLPLSREGGEAIAVMGRGSRVLQRLTGASDCGKQAAGKH